MGLKETLDLVMQYPRIKFIKVDGDTITVELLDPKPQVQEAMIPLASGMPSDDKMLFMSSEGLADDDDQA